MPLLPSLRSTARSPILQVLKTSVAVIAAWLLCSALFTQQAPIFAAIAALLVVQPSVNQSIAKGLERSVGVILGVVLAYGVGFWFGTASWVRMISASTPANRKKKNDAPVYQRPTT